MSGGFFDVFLKFFQGNYLTRLFCGLIAQDTISQKIFKVLCNCNPSSSNSPGFNFEKELAIFDALGIPILIESYLKAEEQNITLVQYIVKNYCPTYDTTYRSMGRVATKFYDIEYYVENIINTGGEKSVPYLLKALYTDTKERDSYYNFLRQTVNEKFHSEILELLSNKNSISCYDIYNIATILAQIGDSTTSIHLLDSIVSDSCVYFDARIRCAQVLGSLKSKESVTRIVRLLNAYCNDEKRYFFSEEIESFSYEIPTALWQITGRDDGFIDNLVSMDKCGWKKELRKEIHGDKKTCLKICKQWNAIALETNKK